MGSEQFLRFVIGGHGFDVRCLNSEDIRRLIPSYSPFQRAEHSDAPVVCVATVDDSFQMELGQEVGVFCCGGADYGVYRTPEGGYQYEFYDLHGVLCAQMQTSADFSQATIAVRGTTWTERNYGVGNALMLAYAFAVVDKDTLLMHASVIRNRNRAFLFLGRSGTGKSTHTRLWREWIPGSDLINDDNPVLRFIDGKAIVYGSPWSGKTHCYRRISVPVHGIVKLEQRPYNKIERQTPVNAFAVTMPSASNMKWDKRVHNAMCNACCKILGCTPVYLLGCLPNGDAARLCYQTVTASHA